MIQNILIYFVYITMKRLKKSSYRSKFHNILIIF